MDAKGLAVCRRGTNATAQRDPVRRGQTDLHPHENHAKPKVWMVRGWKRGVGEAKHKPVRAGPNPTRPSRGGAGPPPSSGVRGPPTWSPALHPPPGDEKRFLEPLWAPAGLPPQEGGTRGGSQGRDWSLGVLSLGGGWLGWSNGAHDPQKQHHNDQPLLNKTRGTPHIKIMMPEAQRGVGAGPTAPSDQTIDGRNVRCNAVISQQLHIQRCDCFRPLRLPTPQLPPDRTVAWRGHS